MRSILLSLLFPSLVLAEGGELSIPEAMPSFIATTEAPAQESLPIETKKEAPPQEIEPFTGKIIGSRVRMRLNPTLDGPILSELSSNDLVIVTGQIDDFYTVKPNASWKGYIYRAYVLDNIVEANNVNLRLEPNTNAPVLAQLQQGDHITGALCPDNNKWLEVELPESVCFYIAKTYITNAGDVSLYHKTQTRRQHLEKKVATLKESVQAEMHKPFRDIQLMPYLNELKEIAAQHEEFPLPAEQAQTIIKTIQEQYITLSQESPSDNSSTDVALETNEPQPIEEPVNPKTPENYQRLASFSLERQELTLIDQAIEAGRAANAEEFYANEKKQAQERKGQLIPYERTVKTRPGDFMLVDTKTKVPVAYLYSCSVDLAPFAGQNVRILVSPRPNHHYALPAYFVHSISAW